MWRCHYSLAESAKPYGKCKSVIASNVITSWLGPFNRRLNNKLRDVASTAIFRLLVAENTTYCSASFGGKVCHTAVKLSFTNYLPGISLKIYSVIKLM